MTADVAVEPGTTHIDELRLLEAEAVHIIREVAAEHRASATASALNLDRHWRNARTPASHSPLDY